MTSQRTRERLIQRLMDQGITRFEVLEAIRAVLSAYGAGHPPLTCVELARASIDARVRPDADLLGQAIQRARFDTRQAAA